MSNNGDVTKITTPVPVGTNPDGSKHLFPDSKWGHVVGFLVTGAALGIADAMGGLDLSFLPSWAVGLASLAVGTTAGLITSWAKKNR